MAGILLLPAVGGKTRFDVGAPARGRCIFVLQLTDSPVLGLIATLQSGPILLLAVFTGVLADCLTRRNFSMTTQAVQGALALVLGGWGGAATSDTDTWPPWR